MNNNYTYQVAVLGEPVYYDIFGAPVFQLLPIDFRKLDMDGNKLSKRFKKSLRRISCQGCRKKFIVECCHPVYSETISKDFTYGDPPVHNCIGDSMSSINLQKLSKKDFKEIVARHRHFTNNASELEMKNIPLP